MSKLLEGNMHFQGLQMPVDTCLALTKLIVVAAHDNPTYRVSLFAQNAMRFVLEVACDVFNVF